MTKDIFADMRSQMRPDDQTLANLAATLAEGEKGAPQGAERPAPPQPGPEPAWAPPQPAPASVPQPGSASVPPAPALLPASAPDTPALVQPKKKRLALRYAVAALVVVAVIGIVGLVGTRVVPAFSGSGSAGSPGQVAGTVTSPTTTDGAGSQVVAVNTVDDYSAAYTALTSYFATVGNDRAPSGSSTGEALPGSTPTGSSTNASTSAPSNTGGQEAGSYQDFSASAPQSATAGLPTATDSADGTSLDYSTTNVQVAGIDEGDIVKTDGRYIYTLSTVGTNTTNSWNILSVFAADGASTTLLSRTNLDGQSSQPLGSYSAPWVYSDLYVSGQTAAVISQQGASNYYYGFNDGLEYSPSIASPSDTGVFTRVQLYDISDPQNPQPLKVFEQSGSYRSSRLMDGILYLVSDYTVSQSPTADNPAAYVPLFFTDGQQTLLPAPDIYIAPNVSQPTYTVVTSLGVAKQERLDEKAVLGTGATVYMSADNLYLADTCDDQGAPGQAAGTQTYEYRTQVTRIGVSAGQLDVAAQAIVPGHILDQYSLDEYDGLLRLAVTRSSCSYGGLDNFVSRFIQDNALYVLDADLQTVGSIFGLAPGEQVYSARFMGQTAYLVTYRQVDPLFAIDLSDPTNPTVLSALKTPGLSNYLHPWTAGLLLGLGADSNSRVKLSMFDISDPQNLSELTSRSTSNYYSEAQYNHKAILADPGKGLIGFSGDSGNYLLYSYSAKSGFQELGDIDPEATSGLAGQSAYYYYGYADYSLRGLYIGDCLYIFSEYGLDVYQLDGLTHLKTLQIAELPTSQ
ncbi:MAG: beta-propeller domain-containing protein [Coriobacteriia bacterium]|nr:beta-propeller domain-containing protein [Coriobacteriia bacterium]